MNEEGRFLNPYNFIPFPEHRSEHYDDTDVHTGVITIFSESTSFASITLW